jgi:hypothetical protein
VTDSFTSIGSRREKNIMGLSSAWGGDRDDKSMSATDPRHAYGSMHVMQSGSHVEIDSFIRSTIQVTKNLQTQKSASSSSKKCFLPLLPWIGFSFAFNQSVG